MSERTAHTPRPAPPLRPWRFRKRLPRVKRWSILMRLAEPLEAGQVIDIEVLLATPKRLARLTADTKAWGTPMAVGPLDMAVKVTA